MQSQQYGAHEVMELHEVLNASIDGLHMSRMFLAYVKDPFLRQIVINQITFMTDEYNGLVHFINGRGVGAAIPYRTFPQLPQSNTGQMAVQTSPAIQSNSMELTDRDVASAILGMHKASATLRMHAALECGDQQIRNTLLNSAVNCAHQAYEMWGYMSQRGLYPTPTLQNVSKNTMLREFQNIPLQQHPGAFVASQEQVENMGTEQMIQPVMEATDAAAEEGNEPTPAATKRKKSTKS